MEALVKIEKGSAERKDSTLLFLPPLGGRVKEFEQVATFLPSYNVFALDFLRVFPCEPGDAVTNLANAISNAAEHLGKPILVGFSLGGLAALIGLANGAPARGFINFEGNLAAEDCGHISRSIAMTSMANLEVRISEIADEFAASSLPGDRNYARDLRSLHDLVTFHDLAGSIVRHSDDGDLLDQFIKLPIPKAYVFGELSHHPGYLSQLRANGIEVACIPEAGHFSHVDAPQSVAQFIDARLKEWRAYA